MSRVQSLAQEISDYHERMTAEKEEELRRSEEANQQKQRTLDQILSPRVVLHRLAPELNPGLLQDVPEPPEVKEEPEWSIKQEDVSPV